jgi:hypothetical protein
VIDSTGTETKGKVVDVSSSALTLTVHGVQRRMEQETVRQVQTYGDSLWNGLVIGMAVATPGTLIADPTYGPCPNNERMRCANSLVAQRLLGIGIMGAVGAGIDALIRSRHQVYVAADQAASLPEQQGPQLRAQRKQDGDLPRRQTAEHRPAAGAANEPPRLKARIRSR